MDPLGQGSLQDTCCPFESCCLSHQNKEMETTVYKLQCSGVSIVRIPVRILKFWLYPWSWVTDGTPKNVICAGEHSEIRRVQRTMDVSRESGLADMNPHLNKPSKGPPLKEQNTP